VRVHKDGVARLLGPPSPRSTLVASQTNHDTTKKLQQDCRNICMTQGKTLHNGMLVAVEVVRATNFQNSLTTWRG
jgi:hypothetical protein